MNPAPLFPLGKLLATPGALAALAESGESPAQFLDRHRRGDWGTVSADDGRLNDESVKEGSRILSAYRTRKGERIWIMTEAVNDQGHRAATTILVPNEY